VLKLIVAIVIAELIEHAVEYVFGWFRAQLQKWRTRRPVRLQSINFDDLESPDLSEANDHSQTRERPQLNFPSDRVASKSGRPSREVVSKWRKQMDLTVRNVQQHSGGNHSAVVLDRDKRIGLAIYDSARGQFCFRPDDHDIVLSAADQAAIVATLNSLSR
jgi:hypothetical protein